ncbi:MAG: AAA family ATPase [Sulfolobales archaeon]
MSQQYSDCVLRKLIKNFTKEYFQGGLKDYYNIVRGRSSSYRKRLECSSVDKLTEDDIVEIIADLWGVYPRIKNTDKKKEQVRKRIIDENFNDVLQKIRSLSCRQGGQDYLSVLQNLYMTDFKTARASELATLLYPDEFFIVNSRAIETLIDLVDKNVLSGITREDLEDLTTSELKEKHREKFKKLEVAMSRILKFMKEEVNEADYLDVDVFLYFKNLGEECVEALGKDCGKVWEEWFNQAVVDCSRPDPCQDVDGGLKQLITSALMRYGQVVLYGVPGSGKTFIARCVAKEFTGDERRVKFVTFHPSYSYEEFIEGIRPRVVKRGSEELMEFSVEHGVFKKVVAEAVCELIKVCSETLPRSCEELLKHFTDLGGVSEADGQASSLSDALNRVFKEVLDLKNRVEVEKCLDKARYVLIIDEINRGDISRVFGELITLIENDKRLFARNEVVVQQLPYSKTPFFVPPNLYIIGTMNSADRSIAFVDYALRRRFAFIELEPKSENVPEKVDDINLRKFFEDLNKECLEKNLDRDHRIGHSYLMNVKTLEDLRTVWFTQIRPLLMEYFYGRDKDVEECLKNLVGIDKVEKLYGKPWLDASDFKEALRAYIEPKGMEQQKGGQQGSK